MTICGARRHGLASSGMSFYLSRRMKKMSAIILGLAEEVLAQPSEKTSSEGAAAALLLAHVAWNRAVDPLGGDQVGYYRKVLRASEAENPKCLRELKATDCEALDRKSTRLNSSHLGISYAVFCLKKKIK